MEIINTQEERVIVKKVAYKAIDGTMFDEEKNCAQYESNLVKPLNVYLKEFGFKNDDAIYINRGLYNCEVSYQDTLVLVRFAYPTGEIKHPEVLCYPVALCYGIYATAKTHRDHSWPENKEFNHGHYSPEVVLKSCLEPFVIDNGKLLDVVAGIENWKNDVLPKLKTKVGLLEKYRLAYDQATEECAKKKTDLFFGMQEIVDECKDVMSEKTAYRDREAWDEYVQGLI